MKRKLAPTLTSSTEILKDMAHAQFPRNKGKKNPGYAASTFLPLLRPVSRQVRLGYKKVEKIPVGSGLRLFARWKLRHPVGSASRTRLVYSILTADWHTKVSVLVWRERVIGRRRLLCLHQRRERGTEEIGFGLLPTMTANEAQGRAYQYDKGNPEKPRLTLNGILLRTLTAGDSTRGIHPSAHPKAGAHSLVTQLGLLPTINGPKNPDLDGLLPTLIASDQKGSLGKKRGSGKPKQNLSGLLPTLIARDYRSEKCSPEHFAKNYRPLSETIGTFTGYRLSKFFAAWYMGYPFEILDEDNG
jgi:hypothetical protein